MRGEDDRRRFPAGRITRPVALAVGGGAALTLLGATAAYAGTGDASATGNQSGTKAGQTLDMHDGGIVTIDGGVTNGGAAGANSGVNQVTGNSDVNDESTTNTDQINTDSAEAGSEGSGELNTGAATSGGNRSDSRLTQSATTHGGDNLVLIDQDGFIFNLGLGLANTGFNDGGGVLTGAAWSLGNDSTTDLSQVADATSGASLLVIRQLGTVSNLGAGIANSGVNSGDVTTGKASSTGNLSTNGTAQNTVANGDVLSTAVVEQVSRTRNRGLGVANSGFNQGTVDDSTDTDDLVQTPEGFVFAP